MTVMQIKDHDSINCVFLGTEFPYPVTVSKMHKTYLYNFYYSCIIMNIIGI